MLGHKIVYTHSHSCGGCGRREESLLHAHTLTFQTDAIFGGNDNRYAFASPSLNITCIIMDRSPAEQNVLLCTLPYIQQQIMPLSNSSCSLYTNIPSTRSCSSAHCSVSYSYTCCELGPRPLYIHAETNTAT